MTTNDKEMFVQNPNQFTIANIANVQKVAADVCILQLLDTDVFSKKKKKHPLQQSLKASARHVLELWIWFSSTGLSGAWRCSSAAQSGL